MISYNSELLRDVCMHTQTAAKYLGNAAAASLQDRHSDILAAQNVYELLVGDLSFSDNKCTLAIADLLKVELLPNYPPPEAGSYYDWSTVGRVKLMRINDVK